MTFFRSILVLLVSVLLVLVPYSFGYALSNHHTTPVIVGCVALLLAVAVGFVLTRHGRATAARRG